MKKKSVVLWYALTSSEIQTLISKGFKTAILPMGATEQHGPHLGVFYDTEIAVRLAEDLSEEFQAFVLPPLSIGASDHHLGFAGTLSFSNKTLQFALQDIATSLERSGIKQLYIVNGHGGNYSIIGDFQRSWKSKKLKIKADGQEKLIFSTIKSYYSKYSQSDLGLHAGLYETSMALYTHPESVRNFSKVKGAVPKSETGWSSKEMAKIYKKGLKAITANGVVGRPAASSRRLGKKFYNDLLQAYRDHFRGA